MGERCQARVECQQCNFTAVVAPDDERLAADVVVEHGKESGHKLSVRTVESSVEN